MVDKSSNRERRTPCNDRCRRWQDSRLAKKVRRQDFIRNLNAISDKASEAYPHATWPGWVDHSELHVLNVLRNLDRMIPSHVYDTVGEQEAFVLIASVLLHDIGMIANSGHGVGISGLLDLRRRHGDNGQEIIRRDFGDFLRPDPAILSSVCQIVKNHHGHFDPIQRVDFPTLRGDALLVRLADELDFGPQRAPTWILDHIQPDEESAKHWIEHNSLDEPAIDLDRLLIQITGCVEDKTVVQKLKEEFEAADRQDIQRHFLHRGLDMAGQTNDRIFVVWDCTEVRRCMLQV